ncbi:helix-turn-helix transcriptional regulator [Clostridium tyrobutyricum]|uniref:helix-turn-helix transcriptional regulator n=1 Tax=Clostridium tyrobutyricum TaxID=1519 RepID=UPI00068CE173|nr:helix-turn-helix transcriptional regulator [Clostridium tyrobutyricum]MBR9648743.1 helix-turn-helix transcriptional regulator [Clostridium tyrobutyricum]
MEITQVIKSVTSLKIDTTKIKIERVLKDWTKSKLAEEAGIARKTLAKIEKGTAKNVRITTIEKIAKALGKTIEDFKEN